MLHNIFLLSMLIHAACSVHWIIRELDSAEDDLEEIPDGSKPKEMIFSVCGTCKSIVKSVKKMITEQTSADVIKDKLIERCNKIPLGKSLCRKFVLKHLHTLIDELMTDDGPNTICVKARACQLPP